MITIIINHLPDLWQSRLNTAVIRIIRTFQVVSSCCCTS